MQYLHHVTLYFMFSRMHPETSDLAPRPSSNRIARFTARQTSIIPIAERCSNDKPLTPDSHQIKRRHQKIYHYCRHNHHRYNNNKNNNDSDNGDNNSNYYNNDYKKKRLAWLLITKGAARRVRAQLARAQPTRAKTRPARPWPAA